MKNQTKTFIKKTELVFTTIEIEKKHTLLRGNYFSATFKQGKCKKTLFDETVTGHSIESIIKRISQYLHCEIDERHYIIK